MTVAFDSMVTASEIRWTPFTEAPVLDVTGMSDDDLIVEALADAASYREMALLAIGALHELQREHARHLQQHYRFIDEYRAIRVQVMRGTV